MLAKNPGFTAVAVLTLALGIGANTAIFSVVNAVLIRPLLYPHADRLVHVHWLFKQGNVLSVTGEEYAFWKEHSRVFESAAAHNLFTTGFNLLAGEEPEHVKGWGVSRDFFRVLEVQPFLGRSFTPEEDRPGGPRAVILSYGLWHARFGADPAVVSRAISLNGESYNVVGVMPKEFEFALPYVSVNDVQLWVPLRLVPDPKDDGHNYAMVARLKPGVSLGEAQSDMARVLVEIQRSVPGHLYPGDRGVLLVPYQKWVTGEVREPLLILLVAVGLVLLIATVNVANLLIVRSATRRTEMAVRLALGASAGRVLRQLVIESLLVALAGGATALVVAPWAVRLLVAISPAGLPLAGQARIDWRVLGFTLLVASVAGIAAGLAPSLRVQRLNLSLSLKESGRAASPGSGRERLRRWLVGAEVALSTLLLTGALLLAFSLIKLERVQPGFTTENLWTFHISLTPARLTTASAAWDFEQQTLARLKELPGVQAASVASSLPFEPSLNFQVNVKDGGHETGVYAGVVRSISRDYFRTMDVPVLRGRAFEDSDTATATQVVIVNRAFARECCQGHDPVGSLVFFPPGFGPKGNTGRQIVGVAGDTKEDALNALSPPTIYLPQNQLDDDLSRMIYMGSLSSWAVRSSAALDFVEVQRAIGQVDRGEAVADLQPMSQVVAGSLAGNRFEAMLMAVFAGAALLLAAVGLYGVISYLVAERTHEIGIRVALGAKRRDILRLVLGEGLRLFGIGTVAGLAGALVLTRFLSSMLFGVRPTDPATFLAAAVVLILVAVLASYIPARRAAKVDPMVPLRYE
jgi:predicted permease